MYKYHLPHPKLPRFLVCENLALGKNPLKRKLERKALVKVRLLRNYTLKNFRLKFCVLITDTGV